jgi:hypothetical protein
MAGSCPAILNAKLLPPHSVDTYLVLPELAPPFVVPCVDVLLAV